MSSPTFSAVKDLASTDADAVREIYLSSFEDDERVEFDGLFYWLTHPWDDTRSLLGACKIGRKVVGFGAAIYFANANIGYLPNLAVQPGLRGQGLGSWLTNYLLKWVKRTAMQEFRQIPRWTFWEVRNPEDATNEDDRIIRQRRISFYTNLGATTVPIDYICPPISVEQPPISFIPMVYTYPPGRSITRADALDILEIGLISISKAHPGDENWLKAKSSIDRNWPEE